MSTSRSQVISLFTIIKGSLIEETYAAFEGWDFSLSRAANLKRLKDRNSIGAVSENWLRQVTHVLSRRFDPGGRDRTLVELAQAGCDREVWKPLLLWHMTRDEFLLRDFLIHWLYKQHVEGTYRLHTGDVLPYLASLSKRKQISRARSWTDATTARVASGLLRIAADFGLLSGSVVKEFASYHLPEKSFLYLLHVMVESEKNARRVVNSPDWHMYLMDANYVERELLRLHQFRKLHYEVAGSLARLELPTESSAIYAKGIVS